MSNITELGKELRKLRIDQDEKLRDMAIRIGKSASFISAIEIGKKSPPTDFENAIIAAYNLNAITAAPIRIAADRSRTSFNVSPNSFLGRDTAGLLARKVNCLSDKDWSDIQSILNKKIGG